MKRFIAAAALALVPTGVLATNTNIQGNVQSRCTIVTEIAGVYGNPSADKLSSKPTDHTDYSINDHIGIGKRDYMFKYLSIIIYNIYSNR